MYIIMEIDRSTQCQNNYDGHPRADHKSGDWKTNGFAIIWVYSPDHAVLVH